jgi:hypothetical protein
VVRDGIPRIVNADKEQQERRSAGDPCTCHRASSERAGS